MDAAMTWLDNHHSGYFAWTWDTWGTTCGDLSLILDYNGTPKSPNGTDYKNHLASLLSGTPTPAPGSSATSTKTPAPTATKTPGATPTDTNTLTPTNTPSATKTPSPTVVPTQPPAATPTSTTGTSSNLVVYDNNMGSMFSDGAFGYVSKNACDGAMYFDPNCSYAITYKAWGGTDWTVSNGTLGTAGYTALTYHLNPNGQPISDFGALLTNKKGGVIKEVPLTAGMATALSGGWYQVSVPISSLNPNNVAVKEIQLKNEMNATLSTVHYDDVKLTR
jgi:hypothetical protein